MDDEVIDSATCPMCGEENEFLGVLGKVCHYRCRACGTMYSV